MAEIIEIKVSSNPKMMRIVRGISEEVGKIIGLSSGENIHLQIAVDEVSTNIIRHGYQGDSTKNFKVAFNLLKDRLEVTLEDSAKPFHPQTAKNFKPSNISCGGLGIAVIKRAVDEVKYGITKSGGNQVKLVKYLTKKDQSCESFIEKDQ